MIKALMLEDHRFPCTSCGRSYSQKRNLLAHVRLECGKEAQFPCPVCPYRAKRKGHLKNHVAMRHYQVFKQTFSVDNNIESGPVLECPNCGRRYKKKESLQVHIRVDCNKEKRFVCPFCPYRTARKNNFKVHMGLKHRQQVAVGFDTYGIPQV
ncbi:hypothetical protein J6590_014755 [Homalodisca vitripennis]|nr:hypothetical protein J6590_014755 [Homalodisca vitripennis]